MTYVNLFQYIQIEMILYEQLSIKNENLVSSPDDHDKYRAKIPRTNILEGPYFNSGEFLK